MNEFDERLEQYLYDNDIEDGELIEAIKIFIGKPSGKLDDILSSFNNSNQEYFYDLDFEVVLDEIEYIWMSEKSLDLFNLYCKSNEMYVTEELDGILVKNI